MDRWLEEGEILESESSEEINNLPSYKYCVPPDDPSTTDTNTSITTINTINTTDTGTNNALKRNFNESIIDNELLTQQPSKKRRKIESVISNPYPTLTHHIPSPLFVNQSEKTYSYSNYNQYKHRNHKHNVNYPAITNTNLALFEDLTLHSQSNHHINNGYKNGYHQVNGTGYHNGYHQANDDDDDDDGSSVDPELELLKQAAIKSVSKINKNQLNSSALLADDPLEYNYCNYIYCKSIVNKIVNNTCNTLPPISNGLNPNLSTPNTNMNVNKPSSNLESLRQLALKSIRIPMKSVQSVASSIPSIPSIQSFQSVPSISSIQSVSSTSVDTKSVDMDISENECDHDQNENINQFNLNNNNNNKQVQDNNHNNNNDISQFHIQSQKLKLILSQIIKKSEELNQLKKSAATVGNELHSFINKYGLSPHIHNVLDGLIEQHIDYNNNYMHTNHIKKQIKNKSRKKKKKKKRKRNNNKYKKIQNKTITNHPNRNPNSNPAPDPQILLHETLDNIEIDCLLMDDKLDKFDKCQDLYEFYNNSAHKQIEYNNIDGLIRCKINNNLLKYYQDHPVYVNYHADKHWGDIDVMKQYSIDELTMFKDESSINQKIKS